ncbi:discoidin domain-containing protein, partial [Streptomyces sp. NPDC004031]
TDGSSFSTLSASAARTFDPSANNNTVDITFPAATARYVRINVTANSGWNAAQLSALQVFPSGGGTSPTSASLAANPSSLTFATQAPGTTSAAQNVTLTNTGSAAAAISSVAVSGDFSQTNTCGSSLAANASCTVAVKFAPTASGARSGTLTVTSSATNSPTTVALSGTGTGSANTNLAIGRPTSESSHTDVYPSSNLTDGNQASYWESANNAFPQWAQVDLGSAASVSKVVLQLPAGWGARNETLSVTGSTDGSSFSTLKASASYAFTPGANNTVTITFPAATARYVRVTVTANDGWPAAQLSELQVWNA